MKSLDLPACQLALSALVGAALFIPSTAAQQPGNSMRFAGPVASVMRGAGAAAAVAPGGIIIELGDSLEGLTLDATSYNPRTGVLTAEGIGDAKLRARLSRTELHEILSVVAEDADGKLVASVDPLGNTVQSLYVDPELEETHLGESMLLLDTEIAGILDGGFGVSQLAPPSTVMPHEMARRLMKDPDSDFRSLVCRYVAPPISWHNTTLQVGVGGSGRLETSFDVEPAAHFRSPDGRRLHPSQEDAELASLPYEGIERFVEESPLRFREAAPHLAEVVRLAEAFALVARCSQAARAELSAQARPPRAFSPPDLEGSPFDELFAAVQVFVKEGVMRTIWNDVRADMDLAELAPDARAALFVDEVFYRMSSLTAANDAAGVEPLDLDELEHLVDDADFGEAGRPWVLLARFMLLVWRGAPLPEALDSFATAYEHALEADDAAVRYHTLRVATDLLPVLSSNLFVMELSGEVLPPFRARFSPDAELDGEVPQTECLLRFERFLDERLTRHRVEVLTDFAARTDELVADNLDVTCSLDEALNALSEFERFHPLKDLSVRGDVALDIYARLNYAIGSAAGDTGVVADRLRLLRGLRSLASETMSSGPRRRSIDTMITKLQTGGA